MKEVEFKLPSGKKVKMRECTGLDQLAAQRKFIGKTEDDKIMMPWEEIARCIVEFEGMKQIKGYEDLLQLTNKDLIALNYAYNQINAPTAEEWEDLKGFFGSGKSCEKSPKQAVIA